MSRKLFISFLGTSVYQPVRYLSSGQDEGGLEPLRFVQEATILHFCRDFTSGDAVLVFTTKGSLRNWRDSEEIEGLKTRLDNLKLKAAIENVMIPEGASKVEIWQIFSVVFGCIREDDELVFDITHGFRSLPMLNMVLINYAKLLRNVSVRGIYYGAFEAKYLSGGLEYAPLWNLIEFEILQEWTNKANIFLKTGNAIPLASLLRNSGDENVNSLSQKLADFSKFILVNRGPDILKGAVMHLLYKELESHTARENSSISALTPIVNKVKEEFRHYKDDSIWNGFIAVRWCIRNGLIQQAATLMEEFVTTFIIMDIGQGELINNHDVRLTVSGALMIGFEQEFIYASLDETKPEIGRIREWQHAFVPKIKALPYKSRLRRIVDKLKNIRNDVNHAGFRDRSRDYDALQVSIVNRYNELRKLFLGIRPEAELPIL